MHQSPTFDKTLINRYDKVGPRYTSYPTVLQFNETYNLNKYIAFSETSNATSRAAKSPKPLSLYFHIPFCNTVCFYCGCSKIVTKDKSKAAPYLKRMHKEITMQAALFDKNRMVNQLHWGGGTPTFISFQEMSELMTITRRYFNLHNDDRGEYSIELDPREINKTGIKHLRELGFNRISLGVQDFDLRVQKSVNRIQSEAETLAIIQAARKQNFKSISLDLIYGLPFQNAIGFSQTLDKVIDASPDRLSIFNYAHLPKIFKPQRRINEIDLPSADEKLNILQMSYEKLHNAGYVYIGMDHFAKSDDELAIAQREKTLYRNFQGYSTHANCDLIAMGITSIGRVGNSYSQNSKSLEMYYQQIDAGKLPIYRGIELNNDDVLRREIINQLICHFYLNFRDIEIKFEINFQEYFSQVLLSLSQHHQDGLIKLNQNSIKVLPIGRFLIRNICMAFDANLPQENEHRYSKII